MRPSRLPASAYLWVLWSSLQASLGCGHRGHCHEAGEQQQIFREDTQQQFRLRQRRHRPSYSLWDYEKETARPERKPRPSYEINQYIYSKAQTAADLMREARYEQERAVLAGV